MNYTQAQLDACWSMFGHMIEWTSSSAPARRIAAALLDAQKEIERLKETENKLEKVRAWFNKNFDNKHYQNLGWVIDGRSILYGSVPCSAPRGTVNKMEHFRTVTREVVLCPRNGSDEQIAVDVSMAGQMFNDCPRATVVFKMRLPKVTIEPWETDNNKLNVTALGGKDGIGYQAVLTSDMARALRDALIELDLK